MNIQLALHSSPRFSTWIWLPDWRLLIDAGDGATQHMGYKIRKIDTVAMTHAHRDHLGGLLQVVNQRGEAGSFAVVYPCGSSSFPTLEAFSTRFNPASSRHAVWHALEEGDLLPGGIEGRLLRAFRTKHYSDDNLEQAPRSLGYHLIWRKQKVRVEYQQLTQAELDTVRAEIGKEGITEPIDEKWITVGGDGAPLKPEEVAGTKLLLHEATFLDPADYDAEDAGEDIGHVHSTVDDALRVAEAAEVPQLVLYHISTRYTDVQIRDAIREAAQRLNVQAKVWAALPRRVYWDILRDRPIWNGRDERGIL